MSLMITATLTLKKAITLLALVEPFAVVPIFVAASDGLDEVGKIRFAKNIAISVVIALLIAAFAGMPLLGLLGVSLGAMQVGGGIIVLLLAIAMVLGKETSFKGMPTTDSHGAREASIIPLAVPLLAGPAAFSYVMANSAWHGYMDLIHVIVPIMIVGLCCWLTFRVACSAERQIRQSTLNLVERIGGFILAAIAVEMIATGLKGLFPALG
jgi:multiple antibiotic resistance protein